MQCKPPSEVFMQYSTSDESASSSCCSDNNHMEMVQRCIPCTVCIYSISAYEHGLPPTTTTTTVCMIKRKATCSIARLLLCYMVLSVKSLLQIDRITVHYSYYSVPRPLLSTTACLLRATYYRLQCMLPLRIQTVCSPLFYGTIPLLTYLNTEYALWAILSSASALLLLLLILHCSAMLQHCRPALATVYTTALLCT
eukprot:13413-Heterococcus_DN1.PRE.3